MNKSHYSHFIIVIALLFAGYGCNREEGRGSKDIENAIEVLRDRRKAEVRVVEEQTFIKKQLEENYKAANSQGMRDKIESEIQMREISIQKALKNQSNQDTIILQLEQKLDSLKKLGL